MTSEEHELLANASEWYWLELGKLVARALKSVPRRLQDELMPMLQDKSSVYGSPYAEHMPRPTPMGEEIDKMLRLQAKTKPTGHTKRRRGS